MTARRLAAVLLLVLASGAAHAPDLAAAPGPVAERAAVSAEGLARIMRLEAVRLDSLRADLVALAGERRTVRLGRWILGRLQLAASTSSQRRAELVSARLLARHAASARAVSPGALEAPALARAVLRQAARGALPLARPAALLEERRAALEDAAGLLARERTETRREHDRVAGRIARLAWWRAERLPEPVAAGPEAAAAPAPGDARGNGLARSCLLADSRLAGGC
jgi:hypothetical protein